MNLFLDELENIRKDKESVIVYGNAMLGKRIQAFLEDYGIDIAAVAVDREYLAAAGPCRHALLAIEDCLAQKKAHNYIVAFHPRNRGEQIRKRLQKNARRILLYDFGYGANDNVLYDLAYYYSYSSYNKTALDEVESWLGDERSRQTLRAYLEQKRTGRFGIYGQHWEPQAYFPDDLVTLNKDAVFVDCGAYTGDSVRAFLHKMERDAVSSYRAIYAFEPIPAAFHKLCESTQALPQCFCLQKGVWDSPGHFYFCESGQESAISASGGVRIETVRIDDVLQGEPATFIKMDIEGAELRALHGAQESIRKHKPALAICVYHKAEDILTIPRFIRKLHPDYRFYLRCHSRLTATELVLYAL